jgi:SAM-dependent methyltransferase
VSSEPLLYTDLADWFHLLTAPAEYAEEAAFFLGHITRALDSVPESLLELGSGGGNNAFHYKHYVPRVTLTDLSGAMLALSQQINPELEHVEGDMRDLRLGRTFDAVFAHDAVDYLMTEDDLRRAFATAFVHLRPGGVALFAPDHLAEHFRTGVSAGGHDGPDGRALRYLEWTRDPDPGGASYSVDFAYLLDEPGQPVRCLHDRHRHGLFPRATWLALLAEAGFEDPHALPFEHSEVEPDTMELFVARRPAP